MFCSVFSYIILHIPQLDNYGGPELGTLIEQDEIVQAICSLVEGSEVWADVYKRLPPFTGQSQDESWLCLESWMEMNESERYVC